MITLEEFKGRLQAISPLDLGEILLKISDRILAGEISLAEFEVWYRLGNDELVRRSGSIREEVRPEDRWEMAEALRLMRDRFKELEKRMRHPH
jgi:hypothetical protein